MAAPISMSISVALLSIIILGFYDFLTNFENNGCEMTYMYEYPDYRKIDISESEKQYPFYGLYIYGEGNQTYYISRNLKLNGIPVLFIPGNAGSYKQVRSLGSVALRMAEKSNTKAHFNYFAVDFNEELSGLYGGVLTKQTEFVHICLKKILSLYKHGSHQPTSVVLVGHSMGGLIARALFTIPDFDKSQVNTIITQATPHQRPVAALDVHLQQFYKNVNQYWRDNMATVLHHVTVVSTGGGYRDIQVRHGLTTLDGLVSPGRAVSVATTSTPKAWVSTDHLCAVWCRQMVLVTKRAMFDLIDKKTNQISLDPELRMQVFRHHFVSNNGLTNYLTYDENKSISLDPKVKLEFKDERLWMYTSRKVATTKYLALPFPLDSGRDSVFIMSNLTNPDWVCFCHIPEGQDSCTSCTSLTSRSRMLPPTYSNTKYVRVTKKDVEVGNGTHILILLAAGEKMVSLTVDHYDSDERHLVYQMPNTYDTIISYPISATDGAALLKIANASSFYSLHLAGLSLPTNTYKAIVTPHSCRRHSAEPYEGGVLRLNIPWSNEDIYTQASYGKELSLAIKLQTGRPGDYDWRQDASEPHLEMFLHPYCHYRLRLVIATQDALGQAVRFYALLLPGYLVAVLLMAVRGVVLTQGKGQAVNIKRQTPYDFLLDCSKPYFIMPTVLVLRYLFHLGPISKLLRSFDIPKDDTVLLKEENIFTLVLPLLLYIFAWVISYLHSFLALNLLKMFSYLGFILALVPNILTQRAGLLQALASAAAISLTFLCGTLGLLLTSALLITKTISLLYEIRRKMDTQITHNRLSLIFPVMLLVNLQTMLSLSPLVIWMKFTASYSWLYHLSADPSQLPSLVVCVCIAVILFSDHVIPIRFQSDVQGWSVFILAVLSILYAMVSMYRLPYFIATAILIITLPYIAALPSQLRQTSRSKGE
ncbi:unnamed protein product [Lymnaea stagnalis]|uniref:GPI inositol-deacylase n=1 Tax=Lymnaea stagnalis TaxID=6523 RepID=A0AAV2IAF0_LYMST